MARTLKFDSDPLLVQITDALRAGPGTPEWHDAITQLRSIGREDADEYQLLYTAREHLASGREYREVRAGPGFTKKVLGALENQEMSSRRVLPAALLIGGFCAVLLIGAVLGVMKFLLPADAPTPAMAEGLAQLYFVNPQASTAFDELATGEWKNFGRLSVAHPGSLRVDESFKSDNFIGGGVYLSDPLSSSEPFELEATIQVPKVSQNIVAQVFVTDDPSFDGESATSPHELVFTLRNGEGSVVLPSGRVDGKGVKIEPSNLPMEVRIKMNRDSALVEAGASRFFTGLHELDPAKPRFAGVRLLAKQGEADSIRFTSVRILTLQKK